jgi:hypothetical protein
MWVLYYLLFRIRDILVRIGSADLCLTDPAPDPAIFVSDLQDANKSYILQKSKVIKKLQNSRNQGFVETAILIDDRRIRIHGPLTKLSGSGSPKNLRILRIRIRYTGSLVLHTMFINSRRIVFSS